MLFLLLMPLGRGSIKNNQPVLMHEGGSVSCHSGKPECQAGTVHDSPRSFISFRSVSRSANRFGRPIPSTSRYSFGLSDTRESSERHSCEQHDNRPGNTIELP